MASDGVYPLLALSIVICYHRQQKKNMETRTRSKEKEEQLPLATGHEY
jgi:hypothetical protein